MYFSYSLYLLSCRWNRWFLICRLIIIIYLWSKKVFFNMDFIWASVCINTLFMINCQQKNEFSESFEVGICIILKKFSLEIFRNSNSSNCRPTGRNIKITTHIIKSRYKWQGIYNEGKDGWTLRKMKLMVIYMYCRFWKLFTQTFQKFFFLTVCNIICNI